MLHLWLTPTLLTQALLSLKQMNCSSRYARRTATALGKGEPMHVPGVIVKGKAHKQPSMQVHAWESSGQSPQLLPDVLIMPILCIGSLVNITGQGAPAASHSTGAGGPKAGS
jgi:hypothetical protein